MGEFFVAQARIDVERNISALFVRARYSRAKLLFGTQIGIRPVIGESVIKTVRMPAGDEQMIAALLVGRGGKRGDVRKAVNDSAVLVLEIIMRADGDAVAEPAERLSLALRMRGFIYFGALVPVTAVQSKCYPVHTEIPACLYLFHKGKIHSRALFPEGGNRKRADPVGALHSEIHPAFIGIIIGPGHGKRTGIRIAYAVKPVGIRAGAYAVDKIAVTVLLPAPVYLLGAFFKIRNGITYLETCVEGIYKRVVFIAFADEHAVNAGEPALVDPAGGVVFHFDGKLRP